MKRIFTLIAITIALITVSTAYGQNSDAGQIKRRIIDQTRVATPRAEAVSDADTTGYEGIESFGQYAAKNALAGTWDVVLTFSDNSIARSTLQVFAGAADGEGSATHASEFSLTPPNPTLPEQGSWRYVRRNKFVASYYGYSFDEQLAPFGKIGFKHMITLSSDQNHFTGHAVFQVIDSTGTVLFSDNVVSTGTRQRAVAP